MSYNNIPKLKNQAADDGGVSYWKVGLGNITQFCYYIDRINAL
jgi:hypothetical protein